MNFAPAPLNLLIIEEEKEDEEEFNEFSRPQIAIPLAAQRETSGNKSGHLGSPQIP